MFRAATKLRTLQKGTSLARPRVPVHLSCYYGGLGVSSKDNNDTAPRTFHIQAGPILRSVYPTAQFTSHNSSFGVGTRRGFASSAAGDDNNDPTAGSSEVDSTLERLFRENEVLQGDVTAEPWVEGAQQLASSGGMDFVPCWYYPGDWAIRFLLQVQELGGLEMGMAIIGTTLIARTLLFPVVASGQRSASRMAHLSPELKALQKRYEGVQNATLETKAKMGEDVNALFKKYETNPLKSMTAPLIQLPFMMGMFFGLKRMPDYFPQEFATGGMYWFTDLSVPDPTYILPGVCFVTFLATVEVGKEQMIASSPENAPMMLMFMRGLSVMMFGVCTTFDGGLVLYFTVTNIFTLCQIAVLKIPAVKRYFGIWDPPKPVPGQDAGEGIFEAGKKLMDRAQGKAVTEEQKIKKHNENIETQKKMAAMSRNRRNRRQRAMEKKS